VKSKKSKEDAGWVEINKEVHLFYGRDDTHYPHRENT